MTHVPCRRILEVCQAISRLALCPQKRHLHISSTQWRTETFPPIRLQSSPTQLQIFDHASRNTSHYSDFTLSTSVSSRLPPFLPSQQFPLISPLISPVISPRLPFIGDQRLPSISEIEKLDPTPESSVVIDAPTADHLKIRRHAARLVRIRRSKMKKHQYKKLKKRYGHVWEYYRTRRRMRRVKAFYAEQEQIIKKAKEFDPESYVRSFITTAKACQEAALQSATNVPPVVKKRRH